LNKPLIITLFLLVVGLPLAAQDPDYLRRTHIVFTGGAMNYIGDLNNQSALSLPDPAFGLGLRTSLGNRWAVRYEAAYGNVHSGDYIERRNLSFKSKIIEAAAIGEFNFWNYGVGATDKTWVFYMYGGIGAFYFNPQASYTDADGTVHWVDLQPLCTEGQGSLAYPDRKAYRRLQLMIPFGVGMKARLNKTFSISMEYGFRKTWTDYLDDVSTTYVETDVLQQVASDPELAVRLADRSGEVVEGYVNAPGIKRGDDSLDDWYAYLHLSIGINLETLLGWTRSKRCKL
jgi:hypothetical protein